MEVGGLVDDAIEMKTLPRLIGPCYPIYEYVYVVIEVKLRLLPIVPIV